VPPDGNEIHHFSGLPDQEISPPGTGHRGERNQPQHVLRRVDLPGEHERGDHEESDLRQARSAPRGQREHGDSDEQREESSGGDEIQRIGRYRRQSQNAGGVPHGTEVDAAISIERVEVPPAIPVREREWHVDNEPGSRCAASEDHHRPPPSTAQCQDREGSQKKNRVELRGDRKSQRNTRPTRFPARPREHRQRRESDRDEVPVDRRAENHCGGHSDHGGIPWSMSHGQCRRDNRDEEKHQETDHVDVEERHDRHRSGKTRQGGGKQGRDPHEHTRQNRVFQRLAAGRCLQVGDKSFSEAPVPEQRGNVGVAQVLIPVGGRPQSVDARVIEEVADDVAESGEQDQYAKNTPGRRYSCYALTEWAADDRSTRRDNRVASCGLCSRFVR